MAIDSKCLSVDSLDLFLFSFIEVNKTKKKKKCEQHSTVKVTNDYDVESGGLLSILIYFTFDFTLYCVSPKCFSLIAIS